MLHAGNMSKIHVVFGKVGTGFACVDFCCCLWYRPKLARFLHKASRGQHGPTWANMSKERRLMNTGTLGANRCHNYAMGNLARCLHELTCVGQCRTHKVVIRKPMFMQKNYKEFLYIHEHIVYACSRWLETCLNGRNKYYRIGPRPESLAGSKGRHQPTRGNRPESNAKWPWTATLENNASCTARWDTELRKRV